MLSSPERDPTCKGKKMDEDQEKRKVKFNPINITLVITIDRLALINAKSSN